MTDDDIPTYPCLTCGLDHKGFGNNPWPLSETGRVCDKCNAELVIPARLAGLRTFLGHLGVDPSKPGNVLPFKKRAH
jgi:hypothetical protein